MNRSALWLALAVVWVAGCPAGAIAPSGGADGPAGPDGRGPADAPVGLDAARSADAPRPVDAPARADAGPIVSAAFPLGRSGDGRTLVDRNGAPFLVAGDAPQCLTARLSVAEMSAFFTKRGQQGFNAAWVNALCTTYTGGNGDATTYDGIAPFTKRLGGVYDLSAPNEAFFARVDAAVDAAAQNGIVLFLDPIETGGFLDTLRQNGVAGARGYGRYLGQRYVNRDNIVWLNGNDFQTWRTQSDDDVVRAVALGIRDMDGRHLQTVELDYPISSSLDDAADWASAQSPILGINSTYTYNPTYAQLYKDYNRTAFLPNVMIEANYEGENNLGGPHTTNAHDCRTQYYWTVLAGGAGSFYGNRAIWPLADGWQSHLDDAGAVQIRFVQAVFGARAWYRLVPDQDNVVVTSGFGTFSASGNAQDNTYATTARAADGTLVMTYMPTPRDLQVDMSKLSAPAFASWYDPTTGASSAVAGSPLPASGTRTFSPPAAPHADGFADWVLILETQRLEITP